MDATRSMSISVRTEEFCSCFFPAGVRIGASDRRRRVHISARVLSPFNLRCSAWSDGKRTTKKGATGGLAGCRVGFTTPAHYAPRLAELLRHEGAEVVWCPTIMTESTDQTRDEVESGIRQMYDSRASGVAFTSRAGIKAFSDALHGRKLPGFPFIVAALGNDADYLMELDLIDPDEVTVVKPATPTPSALVEALGEGKGRGILCPVPLVVDLEEPPVVPDFLRDLTMQGWNPVRVNTYVTRWTGRDCARELLSSDIDALVFTSTAEIEGLMKSLDSLGEVSGNWREKKNRTFLVAIHGPVTARGADRLGVQVDVVGAKFHSFSGVVEELTARIALDRLKGL